MSDFPPSVPVCRCEDCRLSFYVNENGERVSGRRMGKKEHRAHCAQLARKHQSASLTATGTSATSSQATGISTDPTQCSRRDRHYTGIPNSTLFPSPEHRVVLEELAAAQATLRDRHSKVERPVELVFSTPPGPNTSLERAENQGDIYINRGALALLDGHPMNAPLLSYEEWLLATLVRVEPHLGHPNVEVKCRVKILLAQLEDAVESVSQWKAAEWKRQRLRCLTRGDVPLGEPPSVTTGALVQAFVKGSLLICFRYLHDVRRYVRPVRSGDHDILASS